MKSLKVFATTILHEMGNQCGVTESTIDADLKYASKRSDTEGDSFYTISLPIFGKDLEKGLDREQVSSDLFVGFPRRGELPKFLGGFLDLVFDRTTGELLAEPSALAIRAIRQFTLMWAKIEMPTSEKRRAAAYSKFVECEQDVRNLPSVEENHPEIWATYLKMARTLYWDLFSNVYDNVVDGKVVPRHGPGATAEKLKSNQKWNQREWPLRLNEWFPYGDYIMHRWTSPEASDGVPVFLEPGAERPVRVVDVPKTQAAPRIIAIEPTAMQYVQQGLMHELVTGVKRDYLLKHLIGFDDQTPNQEMAQFGSAFSGSLATLDLSEASDRVSNSHVLGLMRGTGLSGPVQSCRSTKADVPGHGVIHLAKFASMGSALTFPVEAMHFLCVILTGIHIELSLPVTRSSIKRWVGKVRVYGDDIIVPVRYATRVIDYLEIFGLKVNRSKSFWSGKFRESCGKEYYDGSDVSIVRVRRVFPTSRKDAEEIVSTVSLRNQLFTAGYVESVEYLDGLIERLIPFPIVESTSPLLGRLSYEPVKAQKMDRRLQIPLVWGAVYDTVIPTDVLDGHGALMKFFLKPDMTMSILEGGLPAVDKNHLLRSGRPVAGSIQLRWRSVR